MGSLINSLDKIIRLYDYSIRRTDTELLKKLLENRGVSLDDIAEVISEDLDIENETVMKYFENGTLRLIPYNRIPDLKTSILNNLGNIEMKERLISEYFEMHKKSWLKIINLTIALMNLETVDLLRNNIQMYTTCPKHVLSFIRKIQYANECQMDKLINSKVTIDISSCVTNNCWDTLSFFYNLKTVNSIESYNELDRTDTKKKRASLEGIIEKAVAERIERSKDFTTAIDCIDGMIQFLFSILTATYFIEDNIGNSEWQYLFAYLLHGTCNEPSEQQTNYLFDK